MAAGREFQAAGPQTAKLQDPNHDSVNKYAIITSKKRITL